MHTLIATLAATEAEAIAAAPTGSVSVAGPVPASDLPATPVASVLIAGATLTAADLSRLAFEAGDAPFFSEDAHGYSLRAVRRAAPSSRELVAYIFATPESSSIANNVL